MLNQVPHEERGIAHAEHGEDRIVERGGAHRVAEGDVAEHGGGTREGGCGCRIVDYYQLPTLPA